MTRLLTLNLQHGVLGATGTVATADELAGTLASARAEAPDVVALQEVDRGQPRSGDIDQARTVADALGLPHLRFAAAIEGDVRAARRAPARSGEHQGPAYGVAIASRYPVLAWFVRPLPVPARDEPRVLLAAVLAAPHGPLTVACTHLSTLPGVALAQLRRVRASVTRLGAPALLAGDLNLRPPLVRSVTRGWHRAEALTFPVHSPDRQIDHLLLTPGRGARTLVGARSLPLPVSDHRGLAAEVR
ncbi:endonuclease/exonuclease/phosphatase family protein [Ruania zhangjianzhongii]|uniref:endonuclease/exonuclease/phosphatase family protein n=1 Tax=Ruania zhangjianzhongii TaxID=2603206 RepID=UPI0011C80356|nr:endonuclease/exonuclease/phosphatase family protein [Ruania zhangjianzhongii]